MEHSYSRSRSKRSSSYDREPRDSHSRHKRHMSSNSRNGPPPMSPQKPVSGDTVFRILCPEAKAGSVIGLGGSIIKALRQETGARITIADAVPGAEDRVVHISGPEREREYGRDRERSRNREGRDRERDGSRQRDGREGDEREGDGGSKRDGTESASPAQEALFRVHSRIVEGGALGEPGEEEQDPLRLVTTRLLVPNNQVGCLLGKGGKIIEQMREETKAQIRVLPRDQLPLCSMPSDEIVQIVGELNVVKKALHMISSRLRDNPPRDRGLNHSLSAPTYSPDRRGYPSEDSHNPSGNSLVHYDDADRHCRNLPPSFSHPGATGTGNSMYSHDLPRSIPNLPDMNRQPPSVGEELVFRILCPIDKIGSIIGKGGSIIRTMRDEIGAGIRVADGVAGSDERVVIISAIEHPEDNISPAQEALLHIQSRIVDLGPDEDAVITTRLLVSSDQVGCLIGKGGTIIAEMRRATSANIRILGKGNLPKCALPSDELVQIVGDIRVAREALIQVTRRLRTNLYEKSLPPPGGIISSSLGGSGALLQHDHDSPGKTYLPYSGLGNSGRSASGYQNLSPSPGHWGVQDHGGGRTVSDFDSPSLQPGSALFSRSSGAIVTKTTVEVSIPEHAVNAIFGNIAQICQISGAKINLLDVRSEASQRVVEISGTPEQTESAQCFLQGFVLSGSSHGYTG